MQFAERRQRRIRFSKEKKHFIQEKNINFMVIDAG